MIRLFSQTSVVHDGICRAEGEGYWMLHVHCVEAMLLYFFAAGHQNYGLVYLRIAN